MVYQMYGLSFSGRMFQWFMCRSIDLCGPSFPCFGKSQANVPRSVTSKSGTFTVLNKQKHVPRNFLPFFHDPKQTTHGIWAGFWAESITIKSGTMSWPMKRPLIRYAFPDQGGRLCAENKTHKPRARGSRQKKKKQKEKKDIVFKT